MQSQSKPQQLISEYWQINSNAYLKEKESEYQHNTEEQQSRKTETTDIKTYYKATHNQACVILVRTNETTEQNTKST